MKKFSCLLLTVFLSACTFDINLGDPEIENTSVPEGEEVEELETGGELPLDMESNADGSESVVVDVSVVDPDDYEWAVYRGDYFDVEVPQQFIIEEISGDAVYFSSPDGAVKMYIYSPLWDGEPPQVMVGEGEELVDEKVDENFAQRIVWQTIKSEDGSYWRSVVDTRRATDYPEQIPFPEGYEPSSFERTTFGIQYRDEVSLEKYNEVYLRFKNSLIKYADA